MHDREQSTWAIRAQCAYLLTQHQLVIHWGKENTDRKLSTQL